MTDGITPARRRIAEAVVDVLKRDDNACIQIQFAPLGWPYVRYHDGVFQWITRDSLYNRIEGEVVGEEELLGEIAQHGIMMYGESETHAGLSDSGPTVWELTDEQDVFTDRDRCFWCGGSDRTHDLSQYKTVEDGVCWLCPDCHESWETADEIVAEVTEAA